MRRLASLAVPLALALAALVAPVAFAAPPPLSASVVGEAPNGGGVFRFPQAVAFSPGGARVFVGDQFSGQVQAFDADGTFRYAFGSRAARRERGRLGVVGGVATDRSGHVYVLDSENDRVQVFAAADGTPLSSWGDSATFDLTSATPGANGGISASGIAVVQTDATAPPVVYVADQGKDRVGRFTLDPVTLEPAGTPTFSPASLGLDHPQGVALDPAASRVYVADDDNHRVVVLDPQTFAKVGQVGSFGTGPGQFQNPYDVAVDAHQPSQLYVADNLNNRVDVFDAGSLAFVATFGRPGRSVPGTFAIVRAVGAVGDDPRGGVAVADTANDRIQELDPAGSIVAAWGLPARGPGYLTRPGGVAFAPDGGVTVADSFDQRIERFDPDGTYAGQLGQISASTGYATQGSAAGQFSVPAGVAYDTAGNVWVADTGNNRVVELDPRTGAVLRTTAAGLLSRPQGIAAAPDGSVVVADTGHGAIERLAADGTPSVVRGGLSAPTAVAVDAAGTVYATDATRVVDATTGADVAPPPGATSWDDPHGIAVDPGSGTLYVAERRPSTPGGARIVRGTRAGGVLTWDTIAGEGGADGQVIEPAGLALSGDGATLLVADQGNNRVLRFDAPGHAPPVTYPLTVATAPLTGGAVTGDLAGIACATDCVQRFGAGRRVTLTATPVAGQALAGWTGDCAPSGTAPTCTLTMDGPHAAGATFAPPPAAPAPPPPPPAVASAAAPVAIRSVRIAPRTLHRARRADPRRRRRARRATRARVTVTLTRAATLTVTVRRGRPGRRLGSRCAAPSPRLARRAPCTRLVAVRGSRTLHLDAGAGSFALAPAFGGRLLAPGPYSLDVVARDAEGHRVGPRSERFTVTR